jgi:hypothetical protein
LTAPWRIVLAPPTPETVLPAVLIIGQKALADLRAKEKGLEDMVKRRKGSDVAPAIEWKGLTS